MIFLSKLFLFMVGHAVADFALQSDFIATNKNRNVTPKGYDPVRHGPMQKVWPHVLTAHALIHGGAVYLVSGSVLLGVLETICHWSIDFGKCEKLYGIHADQFMHFECKVIWAVMLMRGIV